MFLRKEPDQDNSKPSSCVRLVVSDMDGTLLNADKDVSAQTIQVASELSKRGIKLCLVSSRFPPGIERFCKKLNLATPFGALNGAEIIGSDGEILSSLTLKREIVDKACRLLTEAQAGAWIYRKRDWFVTDANAPHVAHEQDVVGFAPTVVKDLSTCFQDVGKIQGVSDDADRLAALEAEIRDALEGDASVHRSNGYYLDITPHDANKGFAATYLARHFNVAMHEVACIGDMSNDTPMLKIAGVSIAMGNAHDDVKRFAHHVTASNDQEGWAKAMQEYVLPFAPGP